MRKICELCGKEFEARQENQRWCSKECRNKGNAKSRLENKTKRCAITYCFNFDRSKKSNCVYFNDARKCKLHWWKVLYANIVNMQDSHVGYSDVMCIMKLSLNMLNVSGKSNGILEYLLTIKVKTDMLQEWCSSEQLSHW